MAWRRLDTKILSNQWQPGFPLCICCIWENWKVWAWILFRLLIAHNPQWIILILKLLYYLMCINHSYASHHVVQGIFHWGFFVVIQILWELHLCSHPYHNGDRHKILHMARQIHDRAMCKRLWPFKYQELNHNKANILDDEIGSEMDPNFCKPQWIRCFVFIFMGYILSVFYDYRMLFVE